MRCRLALLALSAVVSVAGADGVRDLNPAVAARALRRVWLRDGAEVYLERARQTRVHPIRITRALLFGGGRLGARGEPPSSDTRVMLAVYSKAIEQRHPAAARLVRSWLAAPDHAYRAESQLRRVLRTMKTDRRTGRLEASVAAARLLNPDVLRRPNSFLGPEIRSMLAYALALTGRHDEGRALALELIAEGERRRWPMIVGRGAELLAGLGRERVDWPEAVRWGTRAVDAYLAGGSLSDAIDSAENLALAYRTLEQIDAAERTWRVVLALTQESGRPRARIQATLGLGQCALLRGASDHGERLLRATVAGARESGDKDTLALANLCLAGAYCGQGRFSEGHALLQRVLQGATHLQPHVAVQVHLWAARIFDALGLVDRAGTHCDTALARAAQLRPATRAVVRSRVAATLAGLGRYEQARALLTELAMTWRRGGVRHYEATMLALLVRVELELDRPAPALAHARAADALLPHVSGATRRLVIRRMLAAALRANGLPDKAELVLAAALAEAAGKEAGQSVLARTLHDRAALLAAAGRHAEAVAAARRATALWIESARGLSDLTGLAMRRRVWEVHEIGLASAAQLGTAAGLREAWWFREAGAALLLAQLLGQHARGHTAPAMLAEEEGALADLDAAQRADTLARADANSPAGHRDRIRARVDAAHKRLRDITIRLDSALPLLAADPVEMDAAREALPAGTALLSFARARDRVFLFVLTSNQATLVDLGHWSAIGPGVAGWLDFLAAPEAPDTALAQSLYNLLLRPADHLLARITKLQVVCGRGLEGVPFDALVRTSKSGARQRLIERYEITYLPSATSGIALSRMVASRKPGRGILALGDPAYGDAPPESEGPPVIFATLRGPWPVRLRASGDEIRSILPYYSEGGRTSLLQKDANLTLLLDHVRGLDTPVRALHLACHAVIAERARLSRLLLAGGEILSVERLARMAVRADLAVLSACETARGRSAPGEGVIGFARAFFLAGVPRVIASSWPVGDESTKELMVRFHASYATGVSAATALRQAKLALLRRKRTAHPFHWAAFSLWGHGD